MRRRAIVIAHDHNHRSWRRRPLWVCQSILDAGRLESEVEQGRAGDHPGPSRTLISARYVLHPPAIIGSLSTPTHPYPSMPDNPPTTSKRARAKTESHGSDAQLQPSGAGAPTSPPSKRPPKRVKDALASETSSDESIGGDASAPDNDAVDGGELTEEGGHDADDDGPPGVARLVRVIGNQGSSGSTTLTAAQKRARYVARYAKETPERALGMCHILALRCAPS